jgi:hypothetical protein
MEEREGDKLIGLKLISREQNLRLGSRLSCPVADLRNGVLQFSGTTIKGLVLYIGVYRSGKPQSV